MKKEFGKWLMDIAKYIVTAVIITSVLGDRDEWVVYVAGGSLSALLLGLGLLFVHEKENRKEKTS